MRLSSATAWLRGENSYNVYLFVARAGDTDGDGREDLVVGNPEFRG